MNRTKTTCCTQDRHRPTVWSGAATYLLVWIVPLIPFLIAAAEVPSFEEETVDDNIQIGYGVALGDVDGDGRPDILLADKKQFVWYRNPDWTRHVMVENLTAQDNVCIAARDIDGDGKVEVAVGAQWNPGDTVDSGSVHYLIAPDDRTGKWKPVQLHHEPVVHRMRWVRLKDREYVLVVAPLHGRGNRNGQGAGVRLLAYHKPQDPRQPWRTELLEDSMHLTHNLDPCQWIAESDAEELLYIGREGAKLISYDAKSRAWGERPFDRVEGGGEIRMGLHSANQPYLVTIEPLHGDKLVYYRSNYDRQAKQGDPTALGDRIVLDDNYQGGHAIATGDLFGNGTQQIVSGWRLPNRDGKVGIKLYYPAGDRALEWRSVVIDDDTMATEDLRIGDLDGDGRPDIVAAGRATRNLKIYWNRAAR